MKKLDYVDALRGLAILGVIMVHTYSYGTSNVPAIVGHVIGEGARGVQLFYIASAFTLFLSFKNRSGLEASPIKNFFLRRFFRIAPMYYIGICYYLIQDGLGPRFWLGDATHVSIANIISNFTFLHGFNPYWITSVVPGGWSIGVEMTFYTILPLLFSKIKNINQAFNFLLIALSFKLILHLIFMKFPLIGSERLWDDYLFLYFPSQLPIFCLGILMYFIVTDKDSLSKISGLSLIVFSGFIIAQFATGIAFILPNHILFGFGFLILAVALSKFKFILIVNPVINYIGKISFSMYLVHFAVLHWLTQFQFIDYTSNGILNYIIRYGIVVVLTMAVSTICYKLIEVPFQNIGKKIIQRMEKKHSTSPPVL